MNYKHAEVATLSPQMMRTLCEEYIANNYIDPETSERLGVKRGLRNPDGTGVLAGLTNVCDVVGYKKDQEGHVIPIPGKLIYRGVNIEEIVEEAYRNDRFVFEEVIWLLLFGSLPTQSQLDEFCELLAEHRALPDGFMDTMNAPSPNVMNKMQRCVLGLYSYDEHAEDLSLENILNQSINLIASMPTMMVNAYQMKRRYYDKQSMFFHLPKPGQSTAEHILSTYRPDQKFYANKKLPQDWPSMAISILVDLSTSMRGERLNSAMKASMLLYDFATGLDIPVFVAGHNAVFGQVNYQIMADFEKVSENDKYRLAHMYLSGCNRDGAAIEVSSSLLARRSEDVKLLFIISDGQPNDGSYKGETAKKDIQDILTKYRRKGITTFATAIGSDKDKIKAIYGDGYLDITDLSQFPKQLTNMVVKRIMRY